MRQSEKILIESLIGSAVFTGLLYWWVDDIPWWSYAIIFVGSIGIWFTKRMAHVANERRVDE